MTTKDREQAISQRLEAVRWPWIESRGCLYLRDSGGSWHAPLLPQQVYGSANATLIAHAPADIAHLQAELETARGELAEARNALQWKAEQWTAHGDESNGWCPEHPLRLQMDTGPHIPGYDCDDGKDECLPCMLRRVMDERDRLEQERDRAVAHSTEQDALYWREVTRAEALQARTHVLTPEEREQIELVSDEEIGAAMEKGRRSAALLDRLQDCRVPDVRYRGASPRPSHSHLTAISQPSHSQELHPPTSTVSSCALGVGCQGDTVHAEVPMSDPRRDEIVAMLKREPEWVDNGTRWVSPAIHYLLDECERLETERDSARDDASRSVYKGNSADHWWCKAQAYGNIVFGCTPALKAAGHTPDRGDVAGGIADAVKALVSERDTARAEAEALRAERAEAIATLCGCTREDTDGLDLVDECERKVGAERVADEVQDVFDGMTEDELDEDAVIARQVARLRAERDALRAGVRSICEDNGRGYKRQGIINALAALLDQPQEQK